MPILVDYSGIAMASFFSTRTETVEEGILRHLILNTLRMYNVKYRNRFGDMIIACDGGSWRKNVFAEYKSARKTNKDESTIDWQEFWRVATKIREEISENLPFKVVGVRGAEADDVIATIVESTQGFGHKEEVMIISADKDFIQLQKYKNVSQFSPMTKKLLTDSNPRKYLLEHIFRGCSGDGVPNVLSDDDTLINPDKRQPPVTAKKIEHWIANFEKLETVMDDTTFRNFIRNRKCIDFSYIPDEVAAEIMAEYEKQNHTPNSKVLNYLIANQCKMLISCTNDFFKL